MHDTWGAIGAVVGVAIGGGLIAVWLGEAARGWMRPLVYLALLFFGLAALFDILPASKEALTWPLFWGAVATGYGAFWLIGRYVAPICPACAMKNVDEVHHHAHGLGLGVFVAVLSLHCFLDGLGVSAASTLAAPLGLRLLAVIGIHKLPEGFAMTLLLMFGGRGAWRAFGVTAAIEAATLAGAGAGQVVIHPSEFWLALVLANIGGTFLYLSVSGFRDLLVPARRPMTAESERSGSPSGPVPRAGRSTADTAVPRG